MAGTNNSWNNQIAGSYNQIILNAGTNGVAVSTDASAATVNVATGGAIKTSTFGSTNSTSTTTVQSGSGALNVTSTNGALTINSGTGVLGISTDASATTVNMATGGAVKTATFGSTNSTSATTVQSGSGALNITATNGALTMISGTGTLSIANDATAQTVNLATGAGAKVVTLGTTNGASSLALKTGTADFSLASATGTIMSALDTGEITYPLQSAFSAYNSATDNNVTGNGVNYKVICDTEIFDQNADYNNATGIFTAPVTGNYLFIGSVMVSGVGALNTESIVQIGTTSLVFEQGYINVTAAKTVNNFYTYTAHTIMRMTAGDTAELHVQVQSGTQTVNVFGGAATTVYTMFAGQLIS